MRGIARGFAAFTRRVCKTESPSLSDKILSNFVLVFLVWLVILLPLIGGIFAVRDSWEANKFNHLTAAEHLAQAKAACGNGSQCLNISKALPHIEKIPASAPEYGEALKLWTEIGGQWTREREDAEHRAREQMQQNFQGEAHDSFSCATSTEKEPIVSFDDGKSWWKDDGRCADRQQKRRDEDAQSYSYWPTTVRVDTDMDSSWLPDEERTCQTHPDEKGKVSIVVCNLRPEGIWGISHNIPVKFWGGVDRNTVSDWRCRREGGIFVCRATD
jgi:hypothetical protein